MTKRTVLYADEGKVLTDGTAYGKIIFLGAGRAQKEFYEITEEEYEVIQQAEAEKKTEGEA